MPNHTLKTKLEIGILSESDIEVDYYIGEEIKTLDIEAVRIVFFSLGSYDHSSEIIAMPIKLGLHPDYLDTNELMPLCLADAEKRRQPADEFDESRADEKRRGEE